MTFVYPYKRSPDHFDILQSIAWINRIQPDATIYTIGDAVPGALNIPCTQFNNIRGIDVTNRILTFARTIGGDFVYMNDDFYISEQWIADVVYFKGILEINPNHPPHYQEAARNTAEFLMHNKFPINNYECHQPVMMNSEKLIKLFDQINWQDGNHFIKSIYLNVYKCNAHPGDNVKLHRPDIAKASEFLRTYGCFSTGEAFLSKAGVDFLKRGFSLL
jgi:hypothetical protein